MGPSRASRSTTRSTLTTTRARTWCVSRARSIRPPRRTRPWTRSRASIGSQAQLANEIVVEGLNKDAANNMDSGIKERFENLMEHSELDSNNVDLRVKNGVVTLEGTARSNADRTKIESIARWIPGVTQVVNGMTVDEKHTNVADRAKTRDRDVRGTSGTKKPEKH